jgi:uncharacterized membrane protein
MESDMKNKWLVIGIMLLYSGAALFMFYHPFTPEEVRDYVDVSTQEEHNPFEAQMNAGLAIVMYWIVITMLAIAMVALSLNTKKGVELSAFLVISLVMILITFAELQLWKLTPVIEMSSDKKIQLTIWFILFLSYGFVSTRSFYYLLRPTRFLKG